MYIRTEAISGEVNSFGSDAESALNSFMNEEYDAISFAFDDYELIIIREILPDLQYDQNGMSTIVDTNNLIYSAKIIIKKE